MTIVFICGQSMAMTRVLCEVILVNCKGCNIVGIGAGLNESITFYEEERKEGSAYGTTGKLSFLMGRALYSALYGLEGCRYGKPSNWLHIADRLAVGLGTTGSQPVTSATGTSPMTYSSS